jgi:RNA recognition motif-containing protein
MSMKDVPEFVLFIGGLSPQVTNLDLINYFNQHGSILRAKIIADKKTQIPKGYAYVTCKDKQTFQTILNVEHKIMGRDVDVEAAHSGTKIVSDITNQLNKKICVKNLSLETTQTDLGAHFGPYGKIKHAYVIINHQTKRSKQFGYVEFYNDKDCENALKQGPHTVNGVVIECEKFIPKAIERKNKKNVDSEVIQEKLRDLKVKEDEAKEKKLGSPDRSPRARRGIEPAKWNEEDAPMMGRGQMRPEMSPSHTLLVVNDPFGNIMQTSGCNSNIYEGNSQQKSPRSILVSKN